ncbi:MAG: hypothetical protein WC718_14920 [Phycisphaerales bacterium]|jgi:hypothetical protein
MRTTTERQLERPETGVNEADLRRYVERYYPDAGYTFDVPEYRAYYTREYCKSVALGRWPKTNEKPASV